MVGQLTVLLAVLMCSMAPTGRKGVDQQTLRLQVMLDRAGFSVGEIDGKPGGKTNKAWQAYREAHGALSGSVSTATNGFDKQTPATTTYTATVEDVSGPFVKSIPKDLEQQSRLERLAYTSAWEMFGERFHCSPRLLRLLNPHLNPQSKPGAGRKLIAGTVLTVPNVTPMMPPKSTAKRKGPSPSNTLAAEVIVSRKHRDAIAVDANGTTLFYAPVSSGSKHDPLPIGDWTVRGVYVNPHFNYNPHLFWDAEPSQRRARIAAGPNNPVGFVWIDLDRPHYGLHGTPEPSKVGITQSHGCVRLTNWDALRLAALVQEGTHVSFRP